MHFSLRTALTAGTAGGVFFLPLYLPAAVALLIASAALLLLRMLWTGEVFVRRTALDPWLAGFVAAAVLSVWRSDYSAAGWYNLGCLVGLYVLVYVLVLQTVRTRADLERLVLVVLTSAAVVCVWGLFQYYAGIDVSAERWVDDAQFPDLKTRVYSTLGNPNVLAAFLVMVVGLAAGWVLEGHRGRRKPLLALLAVLATICILLTYSRGAWLALAGMALLMAAVWKHWNWRLLLAGAAAAGVLLFAAHDTFAARLLSIRGMFNPADSSVALRWALWESTLAMIGEYPWLGLGWGSYRFIYPYYDFFVQNPAVTIYHGHNTLLSLAAEIGIPGTLCFGVAWGMGTVRALLAMKYAQPAAKGLFLGLLLALSGMAAYSLTDHVLFNIQVTAVFWLLLALTAVMPVRRTRQRRRFWFGKKFRGLAGTFAARANISN